MAPTTPPDLALRLQERTAAWHVEVETTVETEGSLLAFGRRDRAPVVLKLIKRRGDEWHAGRVLEAFDGHGVVRVLAHAAGALLLERLLPGESLATIALEGDDDGATAVLAAVIGRMQPRTPSSVPSVLDWGRGFERYLAGGASAIPPGLVVEAQNTYARLVATQSRPRLLHGDLHHDNVLHDSARGWLAIDPKGVFGELEYEVGAALRNPYERPELFASSSTIARRVDRFASELGLDRERILRWSFAQAVLSAIWQLEDGDAVGPDHPCLTLARAIRSSC